MRKYWAITKIDFKQRLFYFWDFVIHGLFVALILFVFTKLWGAIYGDRVIIEGFTIAQMIWYLNYAEGINAGQRSKEIYEGIAEDVKSGMVTNYLTKPLSYIGWQLSLSFSFFVNRAFVSIFVGAIFAFILVGPISFSLINLVPLIILTTFATLLGFFLVIPFAILAFWLEDTQAFYWITQKALFILGGMLVPIDVYPEFVRKIVIYLPFSYITYGPSKYFVKPSWELFNSILVGQIIWIAIFLIIGILVYRIAIRKVNIHGG